MNRIVLFIRANAFHHRQFGEILYSHESSAKVIIYHSTVHWLSHGKTSRRVLLLRREIIEFHAMNNGFLATLAFLTDFLTHVNYLNQSLQGKETTVCHMYKKVQDF